MICFNEKECFEITERTIEGNPFTMCKLPDGVVELNISIQYYQDLLRRNKYFQKNNTDHKHIKGKVYMRLTIEDYAYKNLEPHIATKEDYFDIGDIMFFNRQAGLELRRIVPPYKFSTKH